ncbi:MAG: hypothetical protein DRI40_01430 [Chloroflexi bacterium]|mgnify:CR=1 FL=1|nr:MAG: hypothetical protein DRI40_01430 [Chloroflexota bacterium]
MTTEFTHPELGAEVRSISGYYVPREESTLTLDGREIIYVAGQACIDASCCGTAAWSYIQVPGFLVRKHVRGGDGSPLVSEIETIRDQETRDRVKQLLLREHPGAQIEVW